MNLALYRVFLRTVLTRQRVIGFIGLIAFGAGVAVLLRPDPVVFFDPSGGALTIPADTVSPATDMIVLFGLMLAVPVSALVFASAALGDLVEDQTLVYLWLRPIARWRVAVAAFAAALTAALPVGVLGTAIGAAIIDTSTVAPAVLAAAVGSVAYVAIFSFVGLVTGRALIWGIGYLLIWEQFIARGGKSLGFLSVHSHIVSIIEKETNVDFALGYFTLGTAVIAPLCISAVMLIWLSRRLETTEVA